MATLQWAWSLVNNSDVHGEPLSESTSAGSPPVLGGRRRSSGQAAASLSRTRARRGDPAVHRHGAMSRPASRAGPWRAHRPQSFSEHDQRTSAIPRPLPSPRGPATIGQDPPRGRRSTRSSLPEPSGQQVVSAELVESTSPTSMPGAYDGAQLASGPSAREPLRTSVSAPWDLHEITRPPLRTRTTDAVLRLPARAFRGSATSNTRQRLGSPPCHQHNCRRVSRCRPYGADPEPRCPLHNTLSVSAATRSGWVSCFRRRRGDRCRSAFVVRSRRRRTAGEPVRSPRSS